MKQMTTSLLVLLLPFTALAEETISGTNFFVVEDQAWETGKNSGYWIFHGRGISHPTEGEPVPIECHGAGFWDADGAWGEGICNEGSGESTRALHWKENKGEEVHHWEYVSGTGEFAGISGGGTYTTTELPEKRLVVEWEGEITHTE